MRKAKVFIMNGMILTMVALLMRGASLVFNIYIANRVGAETTGVFTLVMSVYLFAITVATSGISLACTRIVSEEFAKKNYLTGIKSVRTCIGFSSILGFASMLLLIFCTPMICQTWLKGNITSGPIYAMALGLPLIAISSVIGGYFSAVGKSYKSAISQILEVVDGRKSGRGSKLSEIVKENQAIAGTNAGGFADPNGVGSGNILYDAVIMNRKLVFGNKNTKYRLIGLSRDHKLVLGTYNYQEALNAGIESAVEFGPFLIVNGKDQIKSANSGGIQPRMAIGQKKDGTFIFVCIDGRQPGYSIGTNLLELQTIFKKYGAINAANLDGGSSATMYYDGKVVNKTSTPMGERYLPNAFIVEK